MANRYDPHDDDAWAVVDDLVATGETEDDARRFAGLAPPDGADADRDDDRLVLEDFDDLDGADTARGD